MTSIAEILGPEKVSELTASRFEARADSLETEKVKSNPYREMLIENPELRVTIEEVFKKLEKVPAIHITSSALKIEDTVITSGFMESIQDKGFREKDTNVGIFMKRDGTRQALLPIEIVKEPEIFLRELETLIRHYYHHGIRTNKSSLGENQNKGVGLPLMLIIDIADAELQRGSDYEDHYKLGTSVPSNKIIGEIDLEGMGTGIREKLPQIALRFLELTADYVEKSS